MNHPEQSIPHHWHNFSMFDLIFFPFLSITFFQFLILFSISTFDLILKQNYEQDEGFIYNEKKEECFFLKADESFFFILLSVIFVFVFILFSRRLRFSFLHFFFCSVDHVSQRQSLFLSSYLFWWFIFSSTKWVYVSVVIIIIVIFREFYCVRKLYRKVEEHVYEEPSPRPPMKRYNMSKRYLILNHFTFFLKQMQF